MEAEILKKVKESREVKGFTQLDIANKLDISLVSYSKIERGETKLTVNHIERIAKALGISPFEILGINSGNKYEIEQLRNRISELEKENRELVKAFIPIAKILSQIAGNEKVLGDSAEIKISDTLKDFKF